MPPTLALASALLVPPSGRAGAPRARRCRPRCRPTCSPPARGDRLAGCRLGAQGAAAAGPRPWQHEAIDRRGRGGRGVALSRAPRMCVGGWGGGGERTIAYGTERARSASDTPASPRAPLTRASASERAWPSGARWRRAMRRPAEVRCALQESWEFLGKWVQYFDFVCVHLGHSITRFISRRGRERHGKREKSVWHKAQRRTHKRQRLKNLTSQDTSIVM